MLCELKNRLKPKTVILGIGNTLRSDDGVGSILAARIKDKITYTVYDCGSSPENYMGKVIKDNPKTVVIVDAVDFGAKPGEVRILEAGQIEATNLFSTHNASLALTINYLQNNLRLDIILLAIQPKSVNFGDSLSYEVREALNNIEDWFYAQKG